MTSAPQVVRTPLEKEDLAAHAGADLVDLESVAFAEAALRHQWTWGIVRGISDDWATSLPPGIDEWVTSDGRSRMVRPLIALLGRPGSLTSILRLQRTARAAMTSVGERIRAMMENEQTG